VELQSRGSLRRPDEEDQHIYFTSQPPTVKQRGYLSN
jgi:hypothetical protein